MNMVDHLGKEVQMDLAEITLWLESVGWKREENIGEYRKCYFWKRYPDVRPTCSCNSDKPGIQIVISCAVFDLQEYYEIDVTAECQDGTWVKLKVYSLSSSDLKKSYSEYIDKLIRSWKACNLGVNTCPR